MLEISQRLLTNTVQVHAIQDTNPPVTTQAPCASLCEHIPGSLHHLSAKSNCRAKNWDLVPDRNCVGIRSFRAAQQ